VGGAEAESGRDLDAPAIVAVKERETALPGGAGPFESA